VCSFCAVLLTLHFFPMPVLSTFLSDGRNSALLGLTDVYFWPKRAKRRRQDGKKEKNLCWGSLGDG